MALQASVCSIVLLVGLAVASCWVADVNIFMGGLEPNGTCNCCQCAGVGVSDTLRVFAVFMEAYHGGAAGNAVTGPKDFVLGVPVTIQDDTRVPTLVKIGGLSHKHWEMYQQHTAAAEGAESTAGAGSPANTNTDSDADTGAGPRPSLFPWLSPDSYSTLLLSAQGGRWAGRRVASAPLQSDDAQLLDLCQMSKNSLGDWLDVVHLGQYRAAFAQVLQIAWCV